LDRDLIAERLQKDVLFASGKLHVRIGHQIDDAEPKYIIMTTTSQGHRLAITAVVISPDGNWLYTASKDGSLIKWDLQPALSGKLRHPLRTVYQGKCVIRKVAKAAQKSKSDHYPGHRGEILTMSLSDDGQYLCSGGTDRLLGVWNIKGKECTWLGGLKGHKDTIAALSFRKDSTQIFTSSYDRTMKIFDAAALAYIETLFGHQDKIYSVLEGCR